MAFRRRNKSYPFFSQEFLIQNHADIVFSLVIFILIGLMFEPLRPLEGLCSLQTTLAPCSNFSSQIILPSRVAAVYILLNVGILINTLHTQK
uniref:Uncharacterized protein n=1 Tax=Amphiprion percula TaxID=161767 RepID=A0A3P8U133_AMPPE